MRVLVVGLGKLGLPLACTLAKHGIKTYGYDTNVLLMNALYAGTFTTTEPECDYAGLRLVPSIELGVAQTDMTMVCVQTPELNPGIMDVSYANSAVGAIATAASRPYTVIINSTVIPGTAATLQNTYPNLHIISNPVWIALGDVVRDLENPPVMVLGGAYGTLASMYRLEQAWESVLQNKPHWIYTDTRTAEFIKLAHNAWQTIKMSWMGNIKDHATGINIADVSDFMSHGGERPGAFWKAGPSFGGPCFPRDLRFWNHVVSDPFGAQAIATNKRRIGELMYKIEHSIPGDGTVVILGRGYKAGSTIDTESPALQLAESLSHYEFKVEIDPEPMIDADVYVLMWPNMDTSRLPEGAYIIDTWEAA